MTTVGVSGPDYSAIAALYSQLAGVLAGFAFAGLIALLASQLTSDNRATTALQSFVPLISCFIGLVAASLDYAIIAGEGSGSNRAAEFETVGGLCFSVAGLMLFFSLLVLLHGVQEDAATGTFLGAGVPTGSSLVIARQSVAFVRRIVVYALPALLLVLMEGGVQDQEAARYGQAPAGWHPPDVVAVVLVVLVVGFAVLRSRQARKMSSPTQRSRMISGAAVLIAVLCTAGTNVLGFLLSPGAGAHPLVEIAELTILGAFNVGVIFTAAEYR